jgi:hypothetical protein
MAGSCLLESADDGTAFAKDYPTRLRTPVPLFASLACASVLSPGEDTRLRDTQPFVAAERTTAAG